MIPAYHSAIPVKEARLAPRAPSLPIVGRALGVRRGNLAMLEKLREDHGDVVWIHLFGRLKDPSPVAEEGPLVRTRRLRDALPVHADRQAEGRAPRADRGALTEEPSHSMNAAASLATSGSPV